MHKIFNWMILYLTHGLLAQFKGWRFALYPATSQFTGLFDQVNFEFSFFFPWIMNQILTLLKCLSRKRRGILDGEIG